MVEKVFFDINDFPLLEINEIPMEKRRRGQRKYIKDKYGNIVFEKDDYVAAIAAFDIETTKIPDGANVVWSKPELLKEKITQSVMFVWQFHITFMKDDERYNYTLLGRTWDEFDRFMNLLDAIIDDDLTLMIFVHNLNYEFNYIKSIIPLTNKDGECDIFAIDAHHPVSFHSHNGKFQWRDSLILFNMKLEKVTEGLPHAKISGEDFDYTKKRFSWTPLTDIEIQYCINDVYGLTEGILRLMYDGEVKENLYSLPLTATGFTRRDVKKLMYWHTKNHDYVHDDYDSYSELRDAFRGGNTHCSRFWSGIVIRDSKEEN